MSLSCALLSAVNLQFGTFTAHSYVIVIPEVGMWLSKLSMAGEGTFTVYTGAGIGEDEERYKMQSWPCVLSIKLFLGP